MPDLISEEKQLLADVAAMLRHEAIQARYAGGPPPDTAFACASLLDRLRDSWRDQPPDLRAELLDHLRPLRPK